MISEEASGLTGLVDLSGEDLLATRDPFNRLVSDAEDLPMVAVSGPRSGGYGALTR